jgi:hypothetical protein
MILLLGQVSLQPNVSGNPRNVPHQAASELATKTLPSGYKATLLVMVVLFFMLKHFSRLNISIVFYLTVFWATMHVCCHFNTYCCFLLDLFALFG